MFADLTEVARVMRETDGTWLKWFRRYDALLAAGLPETEALAVVEAARADARAETSRRVA